MALNWVQFFVEFLVLSVGFVLKYLSVQVNLCTEVRFLLGLPFAYELGFNKVGLKCLGQSSYWNKDSA